MAERRIDYDAGGLDDVAISDVSMFRMERLGSGQWWIAVYYADGGRDSFWLNSSRAIKGVHMDERGSGRPAANREAGVRPRSVVPDGWLATTIDDVLVQVASKHPPSFYGPIVEALQPPLSEDMAAQVFDRMNSRFRAWTGRSLAEYAANREAGGGDA